MLENIFFWHENMFVMPLVKMKKNQVKYRFYMLYDHISVTKY